ncbi:MAG: RluA family pseudouridine synthase [Bacteroidota bacterium]|nr:RluA family pseudouridine synthase [Bacteroidota bacterium]MEE2723362.1 RluA family pseudouridine synthase [Bacteroidota bacterium]
MLEIIYEDNHLIAINKRPGDLVQGDKTGDNTLIDQVKNYIKKKYNKPRGVFLGLIHRLDRPTSGLILFAKTSKALRRINKQFKDRKTQKKYWAIIDKSFDSNSGTLTHWLKRNPKMNKSFANNEEVNDSKKAILHYKKIIKLRKYCVLEIDLETGRHHQIRSQLSFIGFPVKGDLKYNAKRKNPDASIDLHARSLTINHPTTKKKITFLASPPIKPQWNFFLSG